MTVACIRPTRWPVPTRVLLLGALAVLLGGCHGSNITPPGTAVVTTGQNGVANVDFASYIVSLASITLAQSNGVIATALVAPQVVDLAQVHNLAELVAAPAVPAGTYTSAAITLDFTSASIWLNVNGQPVNATAVDANGNPLGAVTLTITFDPANPLVITIGQSVRLQIDVDLAAINSINTSTSPPKVTVRPFALITSAPVDATLMRARGVFVTVQSGTSQFIMNLRPFVDQISALGALFVDTNSQTYFNINGTVYTGAAGLNALAQTPTATVPLAAQGTLTSIAGATPTFMAKEVYVGTSLQSPLADYITGTISSRSGNTLNVLGASYVSRLGAFAFLSGVTLDVGSGTTVSEDGVPISGLTAQAVSVGQRIIVSGQASISTSGAFTLDATEGQVRLVQTHLWGTLKSATPTTASLDVLSLGNFAPNGFNFTGTGTSTAEDANPAAYAVNTGSIDESGTAAGTLLQGIGIVSAFGSAPPDLTATTSIPGVSTEQQLVVEWLAGNTHPFTSVSSTGLVVDLTSTLIDLDYIRTGPAELALKSLPASPLITTVGATQNYLQLAIGGPALSTGISTFTNAGAFASAVNSKFNGTNQIFRLVAYGQYNSAANTFVASRIYIALY